jgi:alkanesulfonate monooxygenase SsuD/methylene tetrahydromethanopterin reductase-like flavin-dependent oxidoreductase (luciferase family)
MRLGALIGPTGRSPAPRALVDQVRAFEAEGFDGLWVAQAVGRGMMVPDPLLSLAAAAAVTERVRLGTAVVQLPLYEPAELAHRVFSLRQLAGDRLVLGIGAGSTQSDFAVFGRDHASRFIRFDASLARFRELLSKGADDRIDLTPWPNVLGGPPLLYGTWGKGVARAAREFEGWIASALHRSDAQVIEALRGYRASGGRQAIVSSIFLGPEESRGANRRRVEAFAEAGFDEAAVLLLPGGPSAGEVRGWVPS